MRRIAICLKGFFPSVGRKTSWESEENNFKRRVLKKNNNRVLFSSSKKRLTKGGQVKNYAHLTRKK